MKKKVSTFRDRFSELIESSGVGESVLAAALGVSYKSIYSWKSGLRAPKPPTIASIAQYFEVSPDWLSGLDVPKKRPPDTEAPAAHTVEARLISHGVDSMPQEMRERALTMFKLVFEQYADKFDKENDDDEATGH